MKKIVVKYIVKPLLYIKDLTYRFITYPRHTGALDNYPPVHYHPQKKPLSRRVSFKPETRLKYWSKIAKAYPAFKPLYNKDNISSYLQSINIDSNHKYYKEMNKLYNDGFACFENFLDESERIQILALFKEKIKTNSDEKSRMTGYIIKNDKINEMLHNKISCFERIIFGKKIKKQKYTLSQLWVIGGVSQRWSPSLGQ